MHDEIGPHVHLAAVRELPVEIEKFAPGVAFHGVTIEGRAEQRREYDGTESDDDRETDEDENENDCTSHGQRPARRDDEVRDVFDPDFFDTDFFDAAFFATAFFDTAFLRPAFGAVRADVDVARSGLYAHASISTAPPAGSADT